MSTCVILRLYNSSTAQVCKYIGNDDSVSLKALFCAELPPPLIQIWSWQFNSWAQASVTNSKTSL